MTLFIWIETYETKKFSKSVFTLLTFCTRSHVEAVMTATAIRTDCILTDLITGCRQLSTLINI